MVSISSLFVLVLTILVLVIESQIQVGAVEKIKA